MFNRLIVIFGVFCQPVNQCSITLVDKPGHNRGFSQPNKSDRQLPRHTNGLRRKWNNRWWGMGKQLACHLSLYIDYVWTDESWISKPITEQRIWKFKKGFRCCCSSSQYSSLTINWTTSYVVSQSSKLLPIDS